MNTQAPLPAGSTTKTIIENPRVAVLDHGFVELVDWLGSDLTVVNAARVSFGKRKTTLSEGDVKLIRYLAKHQHWSPFRHVQIQFDCKVPEFVARQWYKHVVGISYSEAPTVDHAWNEISLRYVDASDFEYYTPDGFRKQSDITNKRLPMNYWMMWAKPLSIAIKSSARSLLPSIKTW